MRNNARERPWSPPILTLDRAIRGRLEAAISAAPKTTWAAELVGLFDLILRVALQKPAEWTQLQCVLDPSAELIRTPHLHPIGRLIKQVTPHPLFIQDTGP